MFEFIASIALIAASIASGGLIAALTAAGLVGFIASTSAVILLSAVTQRLFGPKTNFRNSANVQVTTRGGLEYRKIVYGQAMVSGPVVYNNVSGTNNEYLWYQIAMADHECEDLIDVWLDGDQIAKADIDWTAGSAGADGTGSGDVSTAKWVGSNSTKAVMAMYYPGHADQVVSATLNTAFADIGTNHRLRGVAHAIFRLLYNADTEEIWQQGVPRDFKAVWKGRKIYDPRLDSTQSTTSPLGSGSHRHTDASTWAWSANPALCVADYLMNYMSVAAATDINWQSVITAADDCDAVVDIPPSPGTETRFTCNGALSLGQSHRDNLLALLSSMDGKLSYTGGQWKVRASVWEASSVSITANDLAADVKVRGSAPRSERFNTVRGFFADPARDYSFAEFQHVTNSTYVTRDAGETLEYDLELPCTNSETMAQRIAIRNLEQADNQIIAELTLNAMGAGIAIGDVVDVTLDDLSWSAKTFRVVEWKRNQSGTYGVTLREDASASYDDPAQGDYASASAGGITVPAEVVPPPMSLSATGVQFGIQLTWTNPAADEFDYIDVYESAASPLSNAWSGAQKVASIRGDSILISHASGETYWYWIRARRNSGDVSSRLPNSDTSTVSATSAGDVASTVQLQGKSLTDYTTTTTDAEVSYRIAAAGNEQSYEGTGGSHATIAAWLLSGANSDYDCRLTVNSGDNPTSGSALATWLVCSSDRTWTLTDTAAAGGALINNCTIEISLASDNTTILASATVIMDVWEEPA